MKLKRMQKRKNLFIDMWYGDKKEEADKIDIFFNGYTALYHGNIYKDGKCIGDYWCKESTMIEKMFPQFVINWGR